jgi:hypothetical protein
MLYPLGIKELYKEIYLISFWQASSFSQKLSMDSNRKLFIPYLLIAL